MYEYTCWDSTALQVCTKFWDQKEEWDIASTSLVCLEIYRILSNKFKYNMKIHLSLSVYKVAKIKIEKF